MRICHVSPHLPPDQAANAILPAQLGQWSRDAGHDVTFVAQEPAQGRRAEPTDVAGRVVRVRGRSASRLARITRTDTIRRARAMGAALEMVAGDAEVLHLHSNGLIVEVAADWARRRRIPFVLTLYGTEIWHFKPRWPFDPFVRAYRGASAVAFYSQRLLQRAREVGLDRAASSVIYPAVTGGFAAAGRVGRTALRAALGISESRVVLNVKRLHDLAGQRYLIDAFAQVANAHGDVRLVICGTGPLEASLGQQARMSGVSDRITFTGLLPNERIAEYAAAADVFALPSLLEALPTVAVEALAAGTPVVSADHPGGCELNELFGSDVELVPRRDVGALARALDAHLVRPRRTTERTAEIVRHRFSPAAVLASYDALYHEAVSRS